MDTRIGKKGAAFLLIMIAVLAIFTAGCTTPTPSGTPTSTPSAEKVIVEMVADDPPSLDPQIEYDSACYGYTQNVYEPLIYYDGQGVDKPVGILATSWSSDPNSTIWTVFLRENVTFHDGTAFNASAVKYSYDRGVLINNPTGPFSVVTPLLKGGPAWLKSNNTQADADAYLAQEAVKVINETCVQFTLSQPYPDFDDVLAFQAAVIVSPSYEQSKGGYTINDYMNSSVYKENMCGTGAYKFVSWTHGDRIILEKNNNYWRTPAWADRIIIRNVPDLQTRLMALQSGEADIIDTGGIINHPQIANNSNAVEFIYEDTLTIAFMGFNQKMKPFDDPKVRQAFIESFDYDKYKQNLSLGYGKSPHGVIPEGIVGYNANVPTSKYNATHAKQLLIEAGFSKDKPVKMTLYTNENRPNRLLALKLLEQGIEQHDLGFDIDVQELAWATLLDKQRAGDLEVWLFGWQADFPTADNFLGPMGESSVYFAPQIGYNNSTFDATYKEYMMTKDPIKRQELVDSMNNGLVNDNVYLIYSQGITYTAYNKNLKGYHYNVMDGSCARYYGLSK